MDNGRIHIIFKIKSCVKENRVHRNERNKTKKENNWTVRQTKSWKVERHVDKGKETDRQVD